MPFKKGDKRINRGGRPKGSKNLTTAEVKELVLSVLKKDFSLNKISTDLTKLDADQRLNFFLRLARLVLPKEQELKIDYDKLSPEQLDFIIKEITQKENLHEV